MSEFNIIKFNDFKETSLISMAESICKEVEDGNNNALNVMIQAKALDFMSKEIIKKVKDLALGEAGNYSKDDSVFNGAKFSIGNTGDTLDYKSDEEYAELENKLKARKDKLKKAFDMNKTGDVYVDGETGETIPVVRIKKHSEQILKISFK
jgi:hypothetical protein